MASASKIFTDQDKKAFYTVQEEQAFGFSRCLGMCFRMKTTEDTKGLFVWVSTSDSFKNSPKRIFARRCIPSKKEGEQPLITSEVHSNSGQNGSVSFIKCSGNENKNYLSFGFYNNLSDKISAYVFDEENIIELKFEKNPHSPEDYKLVSSHKTGLKVSRNFDLSRAVGAPVIITNYEPARNQVVGILDVKTDGSLYPVFFKENTFDLESKGLLRQTDETVESENPITANSSCPEFEDQDKETNTAAPGADTPIFDWFKQGDNRLVKEKICTMLDSQKSFAEVARYFNMDKHMITMLIERPGYHPTEDVLLYVECCYDPNLPVSDFIKCTDSIHRKDVSKVLKRALDDYTNTTRLFISSSHFSSKHIAGHHISSSHISG